MHPLYPHSCHIMAVISSEQDMLHARKLTGSGVKPRPMRSTSLTGSALGALSEASVP